MANQPKNNQISASAAQKKATKKQQRKEEEMAQQAEQKRLKRRYMTIAGVLIIAATINMFFSARYYGTAQSLYDALQELSYLLVAIGGGIIFYGSRFEWDEHKRTSTQMVGLVFIIIAGGRLVTNILRYVMGW